MPPAATRVVPREEMTVVGKGTREERRVGHVEVSALTVGERREELVGLAGARREMVWTWEEVVGEVRRVESMWEPTRPVEPNMAVEVGGEVDILMCCLMCVLYRGFKAGVCGFVEMVVVGVVREGEELSV